MKGRNRFTPVEADLIRELLRRKAGADRDSQKKFRGQQRKIGFYITDFSQSQDGYLPQDFDRDVAAGRIIIEGAGVIPAVLPPPEPGPSTVTPVPRQPVVASRGRVDADEAYVVDLCDSALGDTALRQYRFPFLRGDSGHPLPVDAYYPVLKLVVEYRERQHTESVAFFDQRMTVSGVGRGVQRAMYDQRRRDVLPQHGLTLVELSFADFSHDSRKRLLRNPAADLEIVRLALSHWTGAMHV